MALAAEEVFPRAPPDAPSSANPLRKRRAACWPWARLCWRRGSTRQPSPLFWGRQSGINAGDRVARDLQDHLHRQHPDRQTPCRSGRPAYEARDDGARWSCACCCLQRCRSRGNGGTAGPRQVHQCRPDLPLPVSLFCGGEHCRKICHPLRGGRGKRWATAWTPPPRSVPSPTSAV